MAPHSSTLAWQIPRAEEPVGCSPWGLKELDVTEKLSMRTRDENLIFYYYSEYKKSFPLSLLHLALPLFSINMGFQIVI